jgi:hypothetical protein
VLRQRLVRRERAVLFVTGPGVEARRTITKYAYDPKAAWLVNA